MAAKKQKSVAMKSFRFSAKLFYGGSAKCSIFTSITIRAPSARVARSILDNYGVGSYSLEAVDS